MLKASYGGWVILGKGNDHLFSQRGGDWMSDKARWSFQILLFMLAAGFVVYGAVRGEVAMVLTKAVVICLECIGLG